MELSLLSAYISLTFLILGPITGVLNRYVFKKNRGSNYRNAFSAALKRKKYFSQLSMLFLILAALLSMTASKKESKMSNIDSINLEKSLEKINNSINTVGGRIQRIEKYLWPGNPGSADEDGVGPSGGPDSGLDSGANYETIEDRFTNLEAMLINIQQQSVSREEFEEVQEELLKLRDAVQEFEKVMGRIGASVAG